MLLGMTSLPPSLIPALWNISILLQKQATLSKHFKSECKCDLAYLTTI